MPRTAQPPNFVPPMQCLQAETLPEGPDWAYEVKLDGYRAQAIHNGSEVRIYSRNGLDLGRRFPSLVAELRRALPKNSVVDGELVALDERGRPRFNLLQNASEDTPVVFFAFDLPRLAGKPLLAAPLSERRALLESKLVVSESVQLSEAFQASADRMMALAREHRLEGVVAKRLSSCYEQGQRSGAWIKVRAELSQELVIAGYTPGTHGFDAVLVGFYRGDALHFCASVRAGFVPASRRTLFPHLATRTSPTMPFCNLPEAGPGRWGAGLTAAKMKKCVWLKPELVAQFRFLEWTPSDHLRHVSFVALREDQDAGDVVKEGEIPMKKQPQSVPAAAARPARGRR